MLLVKATSKTPHAHTLAGFFETSISPRVSFFIAPLSMSPGMGVLSEEEDGLGGGWKRISGVSNGHLEKSASSS